MIANLAARIGSGALILTLCLSTPDSVSGQPISSGVSTYLHQAQSSMQANDLNGALNAERQAQQVPGRTPYDDYMINNYLGATATALKDYVTAEAAFDSAADSTAVPFGQKALVLNGAMSIGYELQHYERVISYGQSASAVGLLDSLRAIMVARAFYQIGNFSRAVQFVQRSISMDQADGKSPTKETLTFLINAQVKNNDQDGARQTQEKLKLVAPTHESVSVPQQIEAAAVQQDALSHGSLAGEKSSTKSSSTHDASAKASSAVRGADFTNGEWIAVASGNCFAQNPVVQDSSLNDARLTTTIQIEQAGWSGQCVNKFATGDGSLQYRWRGTTTRVQEVFGGQSYKVTRDFTAKSELVGHFVRGAATGTGVRTTRRVGARTDFSGSVPKTADLDETEKYRGEFADSLPSGAGEEITTSGNLHPSKIVASGTFTSGDLIEGVIESTSGDALMVHTTSRGHFSHGALQGQGTSKTEISGSSTDSAVRIGDFRDNHLFNGTTTYANQTPSYWENGVKVSGGELTAEAKARITAEMGPVDNGPSFGIVAGIIVGGLARGASQTLALQQQERQRQVRQQTTAQAAQQQQHLTIQQPARPQSASSASRYPKSFTLGDNSPPASNGLPNTDAGSTVDRPVQGRRVWRRGEGCVKIVPTTGLGAIYVYLKAQNNCGFDVIASYCTVSGGEYMKCPQQGGLLLRVGKSDAMPTGRLPGQAPHVALAACEFGAHIANLTFTGSDFTYACSDY